VIVRTREAPREAHEARRETVLRQRRRSAVLLGAILLLLVACIPPPAPAPERSSAAARAGDSGLRGAVDAAHHRLVARRTVRAPDPADEFDPVWEEAEPLRIPLTRGSHGAEPALAEPALAEPALAEPALEVELAALRTADSLYLRARWPGAPAFAARSQSTPNTENRLTVHWSIPQKPGLPPPACDVACHTAHTDQAGRLAYLHTETIPPGGNPAARAAGGWQDGAWTLVWSRPLASANPYDLQLTEPGRPYRFFVKVFLEEEGRPDAVSQVQEMVLEP
jgi:hypothetical protein